MEIGESRTLIAAETGRLSLAMNDGYNGFRDNWGTLRVTIRGPLTADDSAPLLSRFRKSVGGARVNARDDWTLAGVEVKVGDRLLITATGKWTANRGTWPLVDAEGHNRSARASRLRTGGLIGRIGELGVPFHIGTLHVLEATESGKLYFAMHDFERDDNSGTVVVTIRSFPGP